MFSCRRSHTHFGPGIGNNSVWPPKTCFLYLTTVYFVFCFLSTIFLSLLQIEVLVVPVHKLKFSMLELLFLGTVLQVIINL